MAQSLFKLAFQNARANDSGGGGNHKLNNDKEEEEDNATRFLKSLEDVDKENSSSDEEENSSSGEEENNDANNNNNSGIQIADRVRRKSIVPNLRVHGSRVTPTAIKTSWEKPSPKNKTAESPESNLARENALKVHASTNVLQRKLVRGDTHDCLIRELVHDAAAERKEMEELGIPDRRARPNRDPNMTRVPISSSAMLDYANTPNRRVPAKEIEDGEEDIIGNKAALRHFAAGARTVMLKNILMKSLANVDGVYRHSHVLARTSWKRITNADAARTRRARLKWAMNDWDCGFHAEAGKPYVPHEGPDAACSFHQERTRCLQSYQTLAEEKRIKKKKNKFEMDSSNSTTEVLAMDLNSSKKTQIKAGQSAYFKVEMPEGFKTPTTMSFSVVISRDKRQYEDLALIKMLRVYLSIRTRTPSERECEYSSVGSNPIIIEPTQECKAFGATLYIAVLNTADPFKDTLMPEEGVPVEFRSVLIPYVDKGKEEAYRKAQEDIFEIVAKGVEESHARLRKCENGRHGFQDFLNAKDEFWEKMDEAEQERQQREEQQKLEQLQKQQQQRLNRFSRPSSAIGLTSTNTSINNAATPNKTTISIPSPQHRPVTATPTRKSMGERVLVTAFRTLASPSSSSTTTATKSQSSSPSSLQPSPSSTIVSPTVLSPTNFQTPKFPRQQSIIGKRISMSQSSTTPSPITRHSSWSVMVPQ